jgi:hypothetical protein
MRVFVAGGSGVNGRRLVPQLVARGHRVTATTTNAAKLGPPFPWRAPAGPASGTPTGGSPPPPGCAQRERTTCWPPRRRPAYPTSSRRAWPARSGTPRVDG